MNVTEDDVRQAAREAAEAIRRLCARIAELEAMVRTLVDGFYSDDDALPTTEQWDDARALVSHVAAKD